MLHIAPALLCVAFLSAPSELDTVASSRAAVHCASAIDEVLVDVTAIAASWEERADFQGWSPSRWPSQGVPELARLLDAHAEVFTKIDAIVSDPSLRDAVRLTERVREHGAPSLMQTRYLCDVLCARSVICASRGEMIEAAERLDQAVQLCVAMTADSSWGRAILSSLSCIWLDTLTALFTIPSFDPIAAWAHLDARLSGISNDLDADVEHESRFTTWSTKQVLARAQLMRSALAVSGYHRGHAAWPASLGEAFANLGGECDSTRSPSELTCLRRTSSGVCIFALIDTPVAAGLQRVSITLRESSGSSDAR